MVINSSTVNVVSSNNQSASKISQLEAQVQTYEVQLQQEKDVTKQQTIKTKIQQLEEQIKTYQANQKSSDSSKTEATPKSSSSFSSPVDTIEISEEGKALSESLNTLNKNQSQSSDDESENTNEDVE